MRSEQLDDLGKRPVEDVGVEFVESLGDVIFKYGDVERVLDGLGVILGKLDDRGCAFGPAKGLSGVLVGLADL